MSERYQRVLCYNNLKRCAFEALLPGFYVMVYVKNSVVIDV